MSAVVPSARLLVMQFEGCPLQAYWDRYGRCWTIGWGHTGTDVAPGLAWTQDQADAVLDQDLAQAAHLLALYSPTVSKPGQVAALTDFIFNLGPIAYRNSTLRQVVNAGQWMSAKTEILRWDHSSGTVVPGLLRRRQAEADLIELV